tara:strand:- start:2123 stop:2392 length:270 start_codon:yes stop_codon:yes gene_type:complete
MLKSKTLLECWDVLHNPQKMKNLDVISGGSGMGTRIYEYLTGTQWSAGSGRGQTGHIFGQSVIDEWTAKNNKIRNDSPIDTQSIRDSLQ